MPVLFGASIYWGAHAVDRINRWMVLGLVLSYFVLVLQLPLHVELRNLAHMDMQPTLLAFSVIVLAFGYHIIIPSLTTYCKRDRSELIRVLSIGSFIPLLINIVVQFLSLGVLPLKGEFSIAQAYLNQDAVTLPIAALISNPSVIIASKLFTFFAIVTSFLGVSLSLSDFLRDGLRLTKDTKGKSLSLVLTFSPPILFLILIGKGFYTAIQFSGAFVAILSIFLPSAMAWNLKEHHLYSSKRGKCILASMMCIGLVIAILGVLQGMGKLEYLLASYY